MKTILAAIFLVFSLSGLVQAETLAKGTFKGAEGHESSGAVEILKKDGQTIVRFASDFSLDGAPDPKIGFGKNGYVDGTIISKLEKLNGAQDYVVPASLDVSKFTEVWLWCEKFGVPLGVAKLN